MLSDCVNSIRAGQNWSLSMKLIMLLPSRKHRPTSGIPSLSNITDLASYMRLLHYFNDGVELPSAISPIGDHNHGSRVPIIGFSATFSRPDQLALSAVFQKIVFHREVTHMLDEGWYVQSQFLCPVNMLTSSSGYPRRGRQLCNVICTSTMSKRTLWGTTRPHLWHIMSTQLRSTTSSSELIFTELEIVGRHSYSAWILAMSPMSHKHSGMPESTPGQSPQSRRRRLGKRP